MNTARRSLADNRSIVLCIVMIFMIVLTGMCCRIEQADSVFSAVTSQKTQQTLSGTERLIDSSKVCTQQLMGRDSSVFLVGNRVVRMRTNLRIIFLFFCVVVALQYLKHILTAVRDEVYHQIRSNTVIVSYIHLKDGKKS